MKEKRLHTFIILLIAITFSVRGFAQKEWQKKGISIPPPICYASGHSHQHFTPPPESFTKRLKSSAGLKSTFIVEYVGFSEEAHDAFQKAVDIWETLIYSPVPIHMIAYWSDLDDGVLGSCGPTIFYENFDAAPIKDCYYPAALAEKMEGEEITGEGVPDMVAYFNKNNDDWYFGTDGETPAGKYDFTSIVLHEIAHGLGFTGFLNSVAGKGSYGAEFPFPAAFDELIADRELNLLVDTNVYKNSSTELHDAMTDNILYHLSPTARAASETNDYARLWAPQTFDEGSSIYHLNETYYNNDDPNALMTPYVDSGEAIHDPGEITLGIFADMGWKFISIRHEEIKDMEVPPDPIVIEASVFSDQVLDTASVRMVYTRSEFEEDSTVLDLNYNEATEKFSVDFSDLEDGQIKYYIEAADIDGRVYRMPGVAPDRYFDFNLGPDTIKPEIAHTPVKSMLETELIAEIVAEVDDNIEVDKVEVEYAINSGTFETKQLQLDSLNIYSTELSFSGLVDGDSVIYRIKATDETSNANVAYLPTLEAEENYFTIYVDGTFEPVDKYFNNFNNFTRDFITSNFVIETKPGFDDGALHSPHPYPSPNQDNETYEFSALLKYPITIKSDGVCTFKEVVLVEPGEFSSTYGSEGFYDYVVVEGSRNGLTGWEPLLDGYDSRDNSLWEQLYERNMNGANSAAMGNKNLYVKRKFYLDDNDYFNVGESIFIRFRLFSDPYANGWGWAIDDLSIQDPLTSSANIAYSPGEINLYPNPMNSVLNIEASFKNKVELLTVKILNSSGTPVKNEVIEVHGNQLKETMNIQTLPTGLYLAVMSFDNGEVITRKLIKK